jgi:hypothetical protein
VVKTMKQQPASIEAAATGKWLAATLAPARARMKGAPTAQAVERVRRRVFGDAPARRRRLAA